MTVDIFLELKTIFYIQLNAIYISKHCAYNFRTCFFFRCENYTFEIQTYVFT